MNTKSLPIILWLCLLCCVVMAQEKPQERTIFIKQMKITIDGKSTRETLKKMTDEEFEDSIKNDKENSKYSIAYGESSLSGGKTWVLSFIDDKARTKFYKEYIDQGKSGYHKMKLKNEHEIRDIENKPDEYGCLDIQCCNNDGKCTINACSSSKFLLLFDTDISVNDKFGAYYRELSGNNRKEIRMLVDGEVKLLSVAESKGNQKTKKVNPPNLSNGTTKYIDAYVRISPADASDNLRCAAEAYVQVYEKPSLTQKVLAPRILNGKAIDEELRANYGYNLAKRDPFYPYTIHDRVMTSHVEDSIHIVDSVCNIKPKQHYPVRVKVYYMNMAGVQQTDDVEIDDGRDIRPMDFINFDVAVPKIDFAKYLRVGESKAQEVKIDVNLKFKVGEATLKADDVDGMEGLNQAINFVRSIAEVDDYYSRSFIITGYASPEGNYQSNKALAEARARYLEGQLRRYANGATIKIMPSEVQPWSVVADTLKAMAIKSDKNELLRCSDEVRAICNRYSSLDEQYREISKLPYYKEIIYDNVLPRLRIDRVQSNYTIERPLDESQVLAEYHNNKKQYMSGTRLAYEYYMLMKHYADSINEVGPIAKAAYNNFKPKKRNDFNDGFSRDAQDERPWSLAAYFYASYLYEKNECDTTILSPFLNQNYEPNYPKAWNPVDMKPQNYDRDTYNPPYNDESIALLQTKIFCKMGDYRKADSIYLGCMDERKYASLHNYIKCMHNPRLIYDDDDCRNTLAESSPWNKMVVYAVQARPWVENYAQFNDTALAMIESDTAIFRPDDPRVNYLKAMMQYRLYKTFKPSYSDDDSEMAKKNCAPALLRAFELDEKFLTETMRWDGYFDKDVYSKAFDAWQERKKKLEMIEKNNDK